MSSPDEQSAVVLEMAEEFLTRYRRGERPSLKEYIDRRPDLADEVRAVFPAMAMLEKIALSDVRPAPAAAGSDQKPAYVGDYRIVREVGRGGMGVVYEAEQVALGRHVALKVLPEKFLADARLRAASSARPGRPAGCTTPTSCRSSASANTPGSPFS